MNLSLDSLLIPKEASPEPAYPLYRLLWADQENPLSNRPLRLDAHYTGIRVVTGCLWVTLNGEDYIVERDTTFHFPVRGQQAVISNAGQADVIFELL